MSNEGDPKIRKSVDSFRRAGTPSETVSGLSTRRDIRAYERNPHTPDLNPEPKAEQ